MPDTSPQNYQTEQFQAPDEFHRLVQSTLSVVDYNNLPAKLELNGAWFLRTMNNPTIMKRETLKQFSEILNMDEYVLVFSFGCGVDVLSAREAIEIQREMRKKARLSEEMSTYTQG